MTERTSETIEIKFNGSIVAEILIDPESKRVKSLMENDYIELHWMSDSAVCIPVGSYIDDEIFGRFWTTEENMPQFHNSVSGYEYRVQFHAHYHRWQSSYVCRLYKDVRGIESRREVIWNLTASLREQLREFMINLQCLGYINDINGWTPDFRDDVTNVPGTEVNALDYFVNIDTTEVPKATQSLLVAYSGKYMLDALKDLAEKWECEYWITGSYESFVIHFGRCETGTEKVISLAGYSEDGEQNLANAENMTAQKDSSAKGNVLYYFGGTQNIPNTYRKELRLKACDVIKHGVTGRIFLNGYKTFGETNEKLDLRTFIGDPNDSNAKQNKFTISIPSVALGGGTYQAGEQTITGDSLIATKFLAAHSNYNNSTLRRFVSVRICGGCKVNINGRSEVVRILSSDDITYIRQGIIEELRVLADLVIKEYKETGEWEVVDYVPLPLTYEQWYGLIVKNNSPLSTYLIYPVGVGYTEYNTLKFRGWLTLNNIALDVNIPLLEGSVSTRLEYSSYLKNEGSINDYLDYQIVDVTIDDVFTYVVNSGGLSTQKTFSLDNILPGSGKFNPNRRANISLVVSFTGNDNQTYDMTDPLGYQLEDYLNPVNIKPNTAVVFTIKSNVHLNKMEWDKVFDDATSPDTLYLSSGEYYIRLFKKYSDYPSSFNRNLRLIPVIEEHGGIKEMSCSVTWSEDYYDSLNYDIAEIKRTDFNVALSDTVWVAKDASDTSIDTIYKYYGNTYENRNFESGNTLIDTIDMSSQEGGNKRNLIAHTANTSEAAYGTYRSRILGFCPDMETFAPYNRLDLIVPEQNLNFQANLYWGDNGFDHAVVGLEMKLVFATASSDDYSCITDFNTGSYDKVAIDVSAQEVSFEPSSGGAQISLPIHLPRTTWTLDDDDFWERINLGGANFLPYIVARSYVTFYDSNNQPIESSSYEFREISLANINDFNFDIEFYIREIDAQILWNTQSETVLQQIDILNTNIPESAIREGTEFILSSDYDMNVPYKWFTGALDDPSSLLSIGDMRLQLPTMNNRKAKAYGAQYGMSVIYRNGEMYIVKGDMAYKDGRVFPYDMIDNPDAYLRRELCVTNDNVYPIALMLIQENSAQMDADNAKGIFTQEKTWYQEVEGESSTDRPSYKWLQYHVNLCLASDKSEVSFDEKYILQNSDPLKIRFLVPEDVAGIVSSGDYNVIKNNCKLAGMSFEVSFRSSVSYQANEQSASRTHTQDYAIVRNEDFGAKLPSEVLCPSNLDPCVLENWNVKALGALGIIDEAEYRMLNMAFEYFAALQEGNFTFTSEMMSDWLFDMEATAVELIDQDDATLIEQDDLVLMVAADHEAFTVPEIGQKVRILHGGLINQNGKSTRIIGYELKLDKPYDSPKLTMGETEAYSPLRILEKSLTKLQS